MKSTCEICGRQLGFFERSLKIENNKLGIGYDTLCSNCYRSVNLAIDKINTLSSNILNKLHTKYSNYPYAQNNINILIFLAVKEVFKEVPDFFSPENSLISTFYPEDNSVIVPFNNLIEITYKILRNSFISVLGKYGLDTYEAFSGYMSRNCLYLEQILTNAGEDGKFVYTDIFVCQSGLVFFVPEENITRSLFVSEDRTLKFNETSDDVTFNLNILKQRYNNLKERPVIKFNRKDLRSELAKKITEYNNEKNDRIENELTALINNLNILIEKDLRLLHPDEQLRDIPLDSVLVCIIKTLFEQDITQDYVKEAPDGLLSLIVENAYPENLERSGLVDATDIKDYLDDACTFITDIRSSFDNKENILSFAFLTPRAYLLSQLGNNKVCLNAREDLPNDLYCGYQHMIYQGRDEFFIPISTTQKNEDGYYFLDGIRIHSKHKDAMSDLEDFFSRYSLNYYENEYDKEREKLSSLRDKELSDTARRIFIGYGYLPFTIYDEWAAIERNIRSSDIFMQELIPFREKKTGTKNNKIFYASRTVNLFEQQASKLAESFEIDTLPVARGLLWTKLKEEIRKSCAEEFIRLAGDFLKSEDSLDEAMIKYSSLESIETDKAYFLGLFIYYLMEKGLLEDLDFLDHYDDIVKLFIKYNPDVKQIIEFSELKEPEKKPFDTENDDLKSFNEKIEQEKQQSDNQSSVLLSVSREKGDKDSFDDLVYSIQENMNYKDDSDQLKQLSEIVFELDQNSPNQPEAFIEVKKIKTEDFSNTAVIDVITDDMLTESSDTKSDIDLLSSIVSRFKEKN